MGSQQREFPFALDRRLRLTLRVERGELVAWAVQLEWFDAEEGRWVWVARYDMAGGRPHRDRNRLARHETVSLPKDPGRALKVAQGELLVRSEEYIKAYRLAKAQGKEAWP